MSPIVELRGSIPLAIGIYHMPIWFAFSVAVIGNITPPLFLIPFIGRIDNVLSKRSQIWNKIFTHFVNRTRNNHEKKFEILKEFGLIILVAIPLPLTGAWTASLAAYIFGIPFRKAVPLIFVGIIIAGILVTLATVGLISI